MASKRSTGRRRMTFNSIVAVGVLLAWPATLYIAYNHGWISAKSSSSSSSSAVLFDRSSIRKELQVGGAGSEYPPSNALLLPPPSSSLAFDQSFGFFDDISDADWTRRQQKARTHRHHLGNPLKDWNTKKPASVFYYYNYEPLFSCPHLTRVGGPGDGPKWTCDPHRINDVVRRRHNETCLVYSFGSGGLYVFEDGLFDMLEQDTTCEFHIFDPGFYDRPQDNAKRNIHYHRWGMKSSYHNDTHSFLYSQKALQGSLLDFKTFPETLRLLGHEHRTIDILKVDCESCEWFCYKDWISHGDVRQLMVETHQVPLPETVRNAWSWPGTNITPNQFFEDLELANFIMFSKEPNIDQYNKGNLVEWSFIKLHPDFLHGP